MNNPIFETPFQKNIYKCIWKLAKAAYKDRDNYAGLDPHNYKSVENFAFLTATGVLYNPKVLSGDLEIYYNFQTYVFHYTSVFKDAFNQAKKEDDNADLEEYTYLMICPPKDSNWSQNKELLEKINWENIDEVESCQGYINGDIVGEGGYDCYKVKDPTQIAEENK